MLLLDTKRTFYGVNAPLLLNVRPFPKDIPLEVGRESIRWHTASVARSRAQSNMQSRQLGSSIAGCDGSSLVLGLSVTMACTITLPLLFRNGHYFIELSGELWLFDTGAPASFGSAPSISLAAEILPLVNDYMGLTAAELSRQVGVDCVGLLGADVLGRFDMVLDARDRTITISTGGLEADGHRVPLDEFMGIPIVTARIRGTDHTMFFDTGAQISYFHGDALTEFPASGSVDDFYPGVGAFQTQTHDVDMEVGPVQFVLRCGTLPGLLGATLMLAGTEGIVGNQVLANRVVGYFPRRRILML